MSFPPRNISPISPIIAPITKSPFQAKKEFRRRELDCFLPRDHLDQQSNSFNHTTQPLLPPSHYYTIGFLLRIPNPNPSSYPTFFDNSLVFLYRLPIQEDRATLVHQRNPTAFATTTCLTTTFDRPYSCTLDIHPRTLHLACVTYRPAFQF